MAGPRQPQLVTSPYVFLIFPTYIMYALGGISLIFLNSLFVKTYLIALIVVSILKYAGITQLTKSVHGMFILASISTLLLWMVMMVSKIVFFSILITSAYDWFCFSSNPELIVEDPDRGGFLSSWVPIAGVMLLLGCLGCVYFSVLLPLVRIIVGLLNVVLPVWTLISIRQERLHTFTRFCTILKNSVKEDPAVQAGILFLEMFSFALILSTIFNVFDLVIMSTCLAIPLMSSLSLIFNGGVLALVFTWLEDHKNENIVPVAAETAASTVEAISSLPIANLVSFVEGTDQPEPPAGGTNQTEPSAPPIDFSVEKTK